MMYYLRGTTSVTTEYSQYAVEVNIFIENALFLAYVLIINPVFSLFRDTRIISGMTFNICGNTCTALDLTVCTCYNIKTVRGQ